MVKTNEGLSKKYYIKTFGCQANEADSNTMSGILEALDFEPLKISKDTKDTRGPNSDAGDKSRGDREALLKLLPQLDLFIVNTCSVRQKSEDKVYGLGKIIKELKDAGKKLPYIVMSGCMVGSVTGERKRTEFDELRKKTPWVDLYINPTQVWDLPNLLHKNNVLSDWAMQKYNVGEVAPKIEGKTRGFVNISYGCDNFCTFCVVPYARGKENSRSKEEILREIRRLALRGVTEIMLCGQNVNSWGLSVGEKFRLRAGSDQKLPFADLLRAVTAIEEIKKINFISSNPFDFTQDLIDVLKDPKISNYLHMAVQSGNNEVLARMNRRHKIEDFLALVEKILLAKPGIELGTDIIVGFPGETREQFMDTVKLFEKITFNVVFISMYSTRKGTAAQKTFSDDVPLAEKKWRSAHLHEVWQKSLSLKRKKAIANA